MARLHEKEGGIALAADGYDRAGAVYAATQTVAGRDAADVCAEWAAELRLSFDLTEQI